MIQKAQNFHLFGYLPLTLTQLKKTPQKFILKLKVNTVFNVRCYLLTLVHHSFHFTAMLDFLLTGSLPEGGFKTHSFFIGKNE